jgi:thiamine phosphate synthase YjbQ (UPF0047 family)
MHYSRIFSTKKQKVVSLAEFVTWAIRSSKLTNGIMIVAVQGDAAMVVTCTTAAAHVILRDLQSAQYLANAFGFVTLPIYSRKLFPPGEGLFLLETDSKRSRRKVHLTLIGE